MKHKSNKYLSFTLLRERKPAGQPARCAVCGQPIGNELWHQCTVMHNGSQKAIVEEVTGHDACLLKYRNELIQKAY